MKKTTTTLFAALLICSVLIGAVDAQDLTITNARILDGAGGVIEQGTVRVTDGRIAEVVAGRSAVRSGRTINARGRTVMPGFVDAHRHIIAGDPVEWLSDRAAAQMQGFLEAGFTTVLSAIDAPQLLDARRLIEAGEMAGPRIYAAAFIPLAGAVPGASSPAGDPARFDMSREGRSGAAAPAIPRAATMQMIEAAAAAGYDYLKNVIITTPGGPEVDTLKFVVAEGAKRGLPTITHAVTVRDTLAAVEAGPDVLVHTPHIGRLEEDSAAVARIVEAGIPMTSTLAVFAPHFDEEGTPLFRDALPFPWYTLSSAGQGAVNARLLWNAGISYGYGTDTSWEPKVSLADELRALSLVFSPADIVTILTRNAARSTLKESEFGTLEVGKLADIVILNGNPLDDIANLLNVTTTIKGGEVLFDAK